MTGRKLQPIQFDYQINDYLLVNLLNFVGFDVVYDSRLTINKRIYLVIVPVLNTLGFR